MDAVFSPDRIYRYRLTRDGAMGGSTCLFIMLNPSTADEKVDDPTIRRCMAYAARWGHARLEVVNLFALRATNPAQLRLFRGDPVGPDNDRHIMEAVQDADIVIAAWGQHGKLRGRAGEVRQMVLNMRRPLYCLRRSKNGQPSHPLYLPGDLEPQVMDTP